jgi:hypothetical protein
MYVAHTATEFGFSINDQGGPAWGEHPISTHLNLPQDALVTANRKRRASSPRKTTLTPSSTITRTDGSHLKEPIVPSTRGRNADVQHGSSQPLALDVSVAAPSIDNLNQFLADTLTLRDLYKKHHWQASGHAFSDSIENIKRESWRKAMAPSWPGL